jgi:hypothetical protein
MIEVTREITLGDTAYVVDPQPVARVSRQLMAVRELGAAFGTENEDASFMEVVLKLGDGLYDVLQAFIPNLMARYKFNGYPTDAAYKADEFDPDAEEAKNSPTFPQLIDALEAAYAINGGTRIKDLVGKILGPQLTGLVRRWIVAEMQARLAESPTSPSMNGDSPSESSTTNEETLEGLTEPLPIDGGSPSLVSSPS